MQAYLNQTKWILVFSFVVFDLFSNYFMIHHAYSLVEAHFLSEQMASN